jgi:intracellular sulfur oxidation DsrE/DsrF family protein
LKVVYHLTKLDKVSFVLGNIQNHFGGVGQALRSFHTGSANPDTIRRVSQFAKAGVEIGVCGNT